MVLELHNLKPAKGANRRSKRVGRGSGSGRGNTSGRGNKGQKSRSGYSERAGFEGGQMPLYRRVPKRGFHNKFAKRWAIVNVETLDKLEDGTTVTPELLKQQGLVKRIPKDGLRVLGKGKIEKKLTVRAQHFSQSARDKIEEAGGTVEVLS